MFFDTSKPAIGFYVRPEVAEQANIEACEAQAQAAFLNLVKKGQDFLRGLFPLSSSSSRLIGARPIRIHINLNVYYCLFVPIF